MSITVKGPENEDFELLDLSPGDVFITSNGNIYVYDDEGWRSG